MKSVLHLISGAGPDESMGGLALMRAPAQHRSIPATFTGDSRMAGWAHPYTGAQALAVWHADGGDGDPGPAPTPNDVPKQAPQPSPQFTQEDLERIAAKEKAQGVRAGARQALEDMAKEMGFTSPEDVKQFVAIARQAEEAKKTEEQKAREALEKERQTLEREKATIAAEKRTILREQALTRLGALDVTDDQGNVTPNLQDALAMLERDLRDEPNADPQKVAEAAAKLKARRPELFGAKPATTPSLLPPAPGGAPAGGGTVKATPAKDDVKARALERARKMGYAPRDAA